MRCSAVWLFSTVRRTDLAASVCSNCRTPRRCRGTGNDAPTASVRRQTCYVARTVPVSLRPTGARTPRRSQDTQGVCEVHAFEAGRGLRGLGGGWHLAPAPLFRCAGLGTALSSARRCTSARNTPRALARRFLWRNTPRVRRCSTAMVDWSTALLALLSRPRPHTLPEVHALVGFCVRLFWRAGGVVRGAV